MIYDAAIIGAGVVGSLIARELSKYKLRIIMLEALNDVAMGTTKANSAIVHAGYDAKPGSLKARLNVQGSKMMEQTCTELCVPYKKTGSLVVAFDDEAEPVIDELYERGIINGVDGLEIVRGDALFKLEPNINKNSRSALLAKTAAIVCPYELCIAAADNAVENGCELKRNFKVTDIKKDSSEVFSINSETDTVQARFIVNAAGLHADDIAAMIGDTSFKISPRRGEYILLDKSKAGIVNHTVFQCPSKMGKGVLVTPTVDDNVLIGPTAVDIDDKSDNDTTREGLDDLRTKLALTLPDFKVSDVITGFSGVRSVGDTDDFIINASEKDNCFINVAGVESPGLSASPAIAEYVSQLLMQSGLSADINPDFNPCRKAPVRFRDLNTAQRKALIKENNAYGRVICRCETVTEGEIIDAIHSPVGARDIDGVKRRTRSGMGRCQGGFCGSKVLDILARELGISPEEVTKFGDGSNILIGKTK